MTVFTLERNAHATSIIWPERREIPCRDLDLDCFGFDGQIPFGDYARCQAYAPELGRCIFLSTNGGET
ncbi:MAG: hypothetical protein GF341_07780 [candidate division Zixibacteria bacterium]|nr:hypothetical protein [candidate division Zixibacteria bacterium]